VSLGSAAAVAQREMTHVARHINVFHEPDSLRKRQLQERLTAMLPDWFGRPDSNAKYAMQAEILDGYVAECEGSTLGMLAPACLQWSEGMVVRLHNNDNAFSIRRWPMSGDVMTDSG
jgi:hypothetical protein